MIPIRLWLLWLLFGALPFQKPISKHFDRLSEKIVPPNLELPSIFYKQIYFYPSDLILLCFSFFSLWVARRHLKEFFFKGPAKYLLVFFFFCLLSILFSHSPHYLLHYFRLAQLGVFVLFFLAFQFFLSEFRNLSQFFKKLFLIILFSSLLQVGIASCQVLTKASLGLKWLGEQNVQLFTFAQNAEGIIALRPSGSFMHPNILGGFLFFAILSTYYLFFSETKKSFKILLALTLMVQVAGLISTLSKSAFLALLLSLVLFVTILFRIHKIPKTQILRKTFPLLFSLVISFLLFAPLIKAKGGFINTTHLSKACDEERILYQKMAWQMHKDFPWFGVGFSQYQLTSPQYQPKDYSPVLFSKVHNIFFLILTETGVFGLTSFMLFLGAIFRITPQETWIRKWFLKHRESALRHESSLLQSLFFAIFVGFVFIGLCDFYLWDNQSGKILFFATLCSLSRLFEKNVVPLNEKVC